MTTSKVKASLTLYSLTRVKVNICEPHGSASPTANTDMASDCSFFEFYLERQAEGDLGSVHNESQFVIEANQPFIGELDFLTTGFHEEDSAKL